MAEQGNKLELKPGLISAKQIVLATFGFTNQDKRVEAALVHFVRKYGQLKPVVVRKKDGKIVEAIEGRKIFAACQQAGIDKVHVLYCGEVSDKEAEEINLALNGITFSPNYVRLSSTMNRLYPGKAVDELIHMLPFPTKDIQDFLELEQFHFSQFRPTRNVKSESQFSAHEELFSEDDIQQ